MLLTFGASGRQQRVAVEPLRLLEHRPGHVDRIVGCQEAADLGWRARLFCQALGQHGACRQLDAGRDPDQDIVEQLDLIVGIVGRCAHEKIGDAVEYFGALGDGAADDRIVQFFD